MDMDKAFFWFGLCILALGVEFVFFSWINPMFLISAILTLISGIMFLFLGRFHFKQIIYHFRHKDVVNNTEEKLNQLDIEIANNKKYFEKLKTEIEKMKKELRELKEKKKPTNKVSTKKKVVKKVPVKKTS